jgi:hypothetical protein
MSCIYSGLKSATDISLGRSVIRLLLCGSVLHFNIPYVTLLWDFLGFSRKSVLSSNLCSLTLCTFYAYLKHYTEVMEGSPMDGVDDGILGFPFSACCFIPLQTPLCLHEQILDVWRTTAKNQTCFDFHHTWVWCVKHRHTVPYTVILECYTCTVVNGYILPHSFDKGMEACVHFL